MLAFPCLLDAAGKLCGHRIERNGHLTGMVVLRPSGEAVFIIAYGPGEVLARAAHQVDADVKAAFAELEPD